MPHRAPLARAVQAAIDADGRSVRTLAIDAAVTPSTLHRWLNGETHGLSTSHLEAVLRELSLLGPTAEAIAPEGVSLDPPTRFG